MRRLFCVLPWLLLLQPSVGSCQEPETAKLPLLRGLSRTHLLASNSANDTIKTAATTETWEKRRRTALAAFHQVAGELPPPEQRGALQPRTAEEVDCGSYIRRLISYQAQPTTSGRVPAYLCIPKVVLQGQRVPAVLCLHPTENHIGHQVVVGLGGKPHRQYAAELAERGFVTLSPSYPQLATYQPDLAALGLASGTIKAVWDNMRGLDYLESLPYVDSTRGFGAIGHSLGGHNAIFTAAVDQRVSVVVSSCGFDSFLDYKDGDLLGWCQERYMPRMKAHLGKPEGVPFDFYELIACLAPRHVFVNAPRQDANFHWDSVARIALAARPVFALYGPQASEHLQVRHPDCAHDFPDAERLESYAFITRVLRP